MPHTLEQYTFAVDGFTDWYGSAINIFVRVYTYGKTISHNMLFAI